MSINKCVITKGMFNDKELRLLVSYDEFDKPLDIINLDVTKLGTICEATVEKVLTDIEACILKLSIGEKGFIETRKLNPKDYIVKHSDKKLVCQEDKFYVSITQDKKGSKPFSCDFVPSDSVSNRDFIDYYLDKYCQKNCVVITDLDEISDRDYNIKFYQDDAYSLWALYDFTKLLENVSSRVVFLKNGGNIIIEPTEALTIIDVNSSKNYGKSSAMETNMQALEESIRQLRHRSISGIIIIDLLKVSKEEEQQLIDYFKSLATADISKLSVHGFTNLGLLEVTRSRMFSPLSLG